MALQKIYCLQKLLAKVSNIEIDVYETNVRKGVKNGRETAVGKV